MTTSALIDRRPFPRLVAAGQGLYFVATGVWPLVHMPSFLAVTGPKTDLWLVETVGILVGAIGVSLLISAARGPIRDEVIIAAIVSAVGLTAIDILYVTRGVIRKVYLADAFLEVLFVGGWLLYLAWRVRKLRSAPAQSKI